jgi:hypothetical protein
VTGRRVLIAGGGTGGHLYPAMALADEIIRRGGVVRFVGTSQGLEARVLPARGYDLAVIDVSPVPFVARPPAGLDAVAHDIWVMRRDAIRHRLQRAGVAVAEWREERPLQSVLEEVREFRRYTRHARV